MSTVKRGLSRVVSPEQDNATDKLHIEEDCPVILREMCGERVFWDQNDCVSFHLPVLNILTTRVEANIYPSSHTLNTHPALWRAWL